MSKKDETRKYSNEVWLFRLGGVFFYQSLLAGVSLTTVNAVLPRAAAKRSNFLILLCSLVALILQLLPSAVISTFQAMFSEDTFKFRPVFINSDVNHTYSRLALSQ